MLAWVVGKYGEGSCRSSEAIGGGLEGRWGRGEVGGDVGFERGPGGGKLEDGESGGHIGLDCVEMGETLEHGLGFGVLMGKVGWDGRGRVVVGARLDCSKGGSKGSSRLSHELKVVGKARNGTGDVVDGLFELGGGVLGDARKSIEKRADLSIQLGKVDLHIGTTCEL
jgi:hypothetical protein